MNLQRVDLNLLVHFDVLLREKNVTRAAEQLGIQHDLTGFFDIGFDGGHDAHFEVVAGKGQLEAFCLQ